MSRARGSRLGAGRVVRPRGAARPVEAPTASAPTRGAATVPPGRRGARPLLRGARTP